MSRMYYQNAFKFSLTTLVIFFSLQLSAISQTKVEQQEINQIIITQPNSTPVEINSSKEQPALPKYSERMRRLLLRLQAPVQINSPQTQPILPNISEQNINLLLVLKQRKLYVYKSNILQASYPVAIGKHGWETPTGKFIVISMVENPVWENPFDSSKEVIPPGLQNPLGERWIGFWTDGKDEIGFHGTYKRDSVGKAVSHGCVRMYNEDVKKLYNFVKIGTPVIVIP
jgi:L,D-transpeptidase ErfK/SrfK